MPYSPTRNSNGIRRVQVRKPPGWIMSKSVCVCCMLPSLEQKRISSSPGTLAGGERTLPLWVCLSSCSGGRHKAVQSHNEVYMYTSEGKEIIHTQQAPQAIGPYSQAIRIQGLVFTAGQVGLDPATGELIGDSIEEQTRQVLNNLKHVLEAADSNLNLVTKTTVFLKDMTDFARMNAIYAEFFPENPPARSTVAVAALPKGA